MPFPKKFLEWRMLPNSPTWHFFIGTKSLCGKETSNGQFNFAETKPDPDAKTCKFCLKNMIILRERLQEVL